jgi:hypothetical protein
MQRYTTAQNLSWIFGSTEESRAFVKIPKHTRTAIFFSYSGFPSSGSKMEAITTLYYSYLPPSSTAQVSFFEMHCWNAPIAMCCLIFQSAAAIFFNPLIMARKSAFWDLLQADDITKPYLGQQAWG